MKIPRHQGLIIVDILSQRQSAQDVAQPQVGFVSTTFGRLDQGIDQSTGVRTSLGITEQPAGAKASALLYSLVESAKANGKEPYAWLCYMLERLPLAQNADDYEALAVEYS
ncbi:hypothetical protein DBV39_10690 [Orrella marina]|uniref:Transposase IS66 C-terminal domain-containing protein n=1 Tax=Orrella marina TaxID=2163011 RepID=A0A2R4XK59_9BURK|nr:hypothetical protein DBV39_10690 [Orrella marina]